MEQKYPVVLVEWVDPHSQDNWTDVKDIGLELMKIKTIGQLINSNDEVLVVALNVNYENRDASCTMIIPRNAIINHYVIYFD